MTDPKAWYKLVLVVSGPAWCQGKTGYLDETTATVYFDPAEEPPTRETEFKNGYLASLLTTEPIRGKADRNTASGKIKSAVTDAFQT
jgi:hypothetical protein